MYFIYGTNEKRGVLRKFERKKKTLNYYFYLL